jgi:hyperosmotically inducible periplasmic protein
MSIEEKQMSRFRSPMIVAAVLSLIAYVASYAKSGTEPASGGIGDQKSARASKSEDRQLAKSVQRALSRAQNLDAGRVFVRATSGAVTLTGTVPSGDQIARAEQVARGGNGVTSVTNKLAVQSSGE